MGCQGEIYNVYGVQLEAKVLWEKGKDQNPVIYGINGKGFTEDVDEIGVLDKLAFEVQEAHLYGDVYGAADLGKKQKLSIRFMGHNSESGMNMGSRHFNGKALVGFTVCNESYTDKASALPPLGQIMELGPRLIEAIKEELDVEVKESDLGLHLLFDFINGM
jgi:hypothetical protein